MDMLDNYNVIWQTPSRHAGESMPVGGGDMGLNVWVEKGELLFYIGRSGTFDENNQMLKLGRVRVRLTPNPFNEGAEFLQELKLREGYVEITGKNPGHFAATIKVWVEVFRPVVHVDINSDVGVHLEAQYEGWRIADRELPDDGKNSRFGCFSYDGYPGKVFTYTDVVEQGQDFVLWYHRNRNDNLVFDLAVKQQGLESVKEKMWNPLKELTFGGLMTGEGMVAAGMSSGRYVDTDYNAWKLQSKETFPSHTLKIFCHQGQFQTVKEWKRGLSQLASALEPNDETAWEKHLDWWRQFWDRSHIFISVGKSNSEDKAWQIGRNYQLFRYMLGCNAYGEYPTKFNGSLFTFDPSLVDERRKHTPDWRAWGGGSFTAQNQRLIYWPMLKSGDFDMMPSQFDFYSRALGNAEARVKVYWGHAGACFTEQIEQFGLPIACAYGWVNSTRRRRPADLETGVQVNSAVNYHYEAQLEFSFMILNYFLFAGEDISAYMPFIESSVTFFDQHYQYRGKQLTSNPLDEDGKLVIYPSTACETYKGAKNPADLIAGLNTVLSMMLKLPERYASPEKKQKWQTILEGIPPLPIKEIAGRRMLQPAESWTHFQNCEMPQFYSVFPFGLLGVGKPDLPVAIDTWRYGDWTNMQKSHISWHQNGIFFARMGLTDEAASYNIKKLEDSGRRFPTFWGPGHDWVPDHNWGGSGMIGLQEMLMQTDGQKILLLPAWPREWDVDFKLHAPYQTIVEGKVKNGEFVKLKVSPAARLEDVVLPERN